MVDSTKLMNELASMLKKMLCENPAIKAEVIVYFVHTIANDCAAGVFDDSDYYSTDLTYDEQLIICHEHNMHCLEQYRRCGYSWTSSRKGKNMEVRQDGR